MTALARTYRPKSFSEIVGQETTVRALSNALNHNQLHHAYLFTGTRGVGKTTLARILAKCLNCETGITAAPCETCSACQEISAGRFPDLFEIDAASRTKVEDTREILDNVQYAPSKGRFKVYLIDEVHMLSGHSFNALLKTLEEPPAHVKFLLATTDHQKLPATVLSRCLQFHLTPLSVAQISAHLETVLNAEKIAFEKPALTEIAKAAKGSLRDALSLLDQAIAYGNNQINTADVKNMLGIMNPELLFDVLNALAARDGDALFIHLQKLAEQGADFSQTLSELLSILHSISVLQIVPNAALEIDARAKEFVTRFSPEDLQLFYQIGLNGQRDLAYAPSPQLGFEMTLLRMLAFYPEENSNTNTQSNSQPAKPTVQAKPINSNWAELLPKLGLSGAAFALAQQCSLISRDENEWQFSVSPKQKALAQDKQIKRIEEALETALKTKIRVKMIFNEVNEVTPAAIQQEAQQAKHTEAKQQILGDKNIQEIMKTFGAEIVTDSIQSTEK